jgi:hypothetical protein
MEVANILSIDVNSFFGILSSVRYIKSKTIKIKITIHFKISYPVLGFRSQSVRYLIVVDCEQLKHLDLHSVNQRRKVVEVFDHQPVQYCDKFIDMLLQIKTA